MAGRASLAIVETLCHGPAAQQVASAPSSSESSQVMPGTTEVGEAVTISTKWIFSTFTN